MPLYEFLTEDGAHVERVLSMEDAPHFFDWVEIEGERLKRIPSKPGNIRVQGSRQFASWTLPAKGQQWVDEQGNRRVGCPGVERYDENPRSPTFGCPLIDGGREIDAVEKASEGTIRYRED